MGSETQQVHIMSYFDATMLIKYVAGQSYINVLYILYDIYVLYTLSNCKLNIFLLIIIVFMIYYILKAVVYCISQTL